MTIYNHKPPYDEPLKNGDGIRVPVNMMDTGEPGKMGGATNPPRSYYSPLVVPQVLSESATRQAWEKAREEMIKRTGSAYLGNAPK